MNLGKLFILFNHAHFEGIIPGIPVVWNKRFRTCAGACHYKYNADGDVVPHKITLNPHLLKHDAKRLRLTLLHEMTHAYLAAKHKERMGHNKEFHEVLSRVSGEPSTRCHSYDTTKVKKWQIVCPNCGVVGHRVRRPRRRQYVCRKCTADVGFAPNPEYMRS